MLDFIPFQKSLNSSVTHCVNYIVINCPSAAVLMGIYCNGSIACVGVVEVIRNICGYSEHASTIKKPLNGPTKFI